MLIKNKKENIEQKQIKFLKFIKNRRDYNNILKNKIQFGIGRRVKAGWNLIHKKSIKKQRKSIWGLFGSETVKLYKQKKWRERISFYAIQELEFNKLSHEESHLHDTIAGSGWDWYENEPPTLDDFIALMEVAYGTRRAIAEDIIDIDDRLVILETEEEIYDDTEFTNQLKEGEVIINEIDYNQKILKKMEEEGLAIFKVQDALEAYSDVYGLNHYSLYPIWKYNKFTNLIEPTSYEFLPEKYDYLKRIIKIKPTEKAIQRVLRFNYQNLNEKEKWEELKNFREYQIEKKLVQAKIFDYIGLIVGSVLGVYFLYKSNILKQKQELIFYTIIDIKHDIIKVFGDLIPRTSLVNVLKEDLNSKIKLTTIEQWLECQRRLVELPLTNSIDVLYTVFTSIHGICNENSEKLMELAKYILEIY